MSEENGKGRYEKAYEWSLRVFNQHIERYERQERKASRYLTGAGLLLGVIGFSGGAITRRLEPLSGLLDWFTLLAGLCTIVSLICLCVFCFMVLSTEDLRVLPSDVGVVNLFREYPEAAVLDRLSQDIVREAGENQSVTSQMGNYLGYAHKALIAVTISAIFFGFGLALEESSFEPQNNHSVIELNIVMSDEESSTSSPQAEGSGDSDGGNGSSENGGSSGPGDAIEPVEFPTIESDADPRESTKMDSDNGGNDSSSNASSDDSKD